MPMGQHMQSEPPNIQNPALSVAFDTVAHRNGESSSMAEARSNGHRGEQSSSTWHRDRGIVEDMGKGRLEPQFFNKDHSRRSHRRSGFLVDSTLAARPGSLRLRAKNKGVDGATRPNRQSYEPEPASTGASLSSSPVSHRASTRLSSAFDSTDPPPARPVAQVQGIDPAQLVQMALSLSESRKRHVSGTLGATPRTVLVESPAVSTDRPVSGTQYARKQAEFQSPVVNVTGYDDQQEGDDNVVYTFSTATIARAERARTYFEQASEYRRLLRHLPPLRPHASRARASTYGSTSTGEHSKLSPSSATNADRNHHEDRLGVPYNPLQSLRNRKARLRDGIAISDSMDCWADPEKTKRWVDKVVEAAQTPQFRRFGDHLELPSPSFDKNADGLCDGETFMPHSPADNMDSNTMPLNNSWTITPSEMLRDAYWIEQEDNKRWLEDRQGNPLFEQSDFDLRRTDAHGNVAAAEGNEGHAHLTNGGPDDHPSSRLRRLVLPLKSSHTKRHKRLLSRTSSSSSSTGVDSPIGRTGWTTTAVSTGPLERYMQERITKEESQGHVQAAIPEMDASDRWGLMRRQEQDWSRRDATLRPGTSGSLNVPRETHRRSRSADGMLVPIIKVNTSVANRPDFLRSISQVNDASRSSRPQSTAPSDQIESNHQHKTERPQLGFLGDNANEHEKIAQTDFATGVNGTALQRNQPSSPEQRRSIDSTRSGSFKSYKNINGLLRYDTNTTISSMKDTRSSVGRFLKGGRIGELVRGEGSFRRDRSKARAQNDEEASGDNKNLDVDDTDSDDSAFTDTAPTRTRTVDDSDANPRKTQDYIRGHRKYHSVNLPDFVPAGRDRRTIAPSLTNTSWTTLPKPEGDVQQGHVIRDSAVQPRLVLPDGEYASGEDSNKDISRTSDQATIAPPGNIRRGAIAFGQRHWSISDQAKQPSKTRVTRRDIARAEALLLASGIKVHEILRRANSPQDPPNKFLVRAAATANLPIPQVPRRKDDIEAMRILSDAIDSRASALEDTIRKFQLQTAAVLVSRVEKLQGKIGEDLTNRVHDMSDSADAFVVELTTLQPQQTKQVDEAVNAMIRQRRRQFRLLRHTGFKLLEWFTLGLMWGIWFFVMILIMIRRVIELFFTLLRWLFTF